MDKWIVVALDEKTAWAVAELLQRYVDGMLPLGSNRAEQEFIWAAHLIMCLQPWVRDPETLKSAQRLMDVLSGEFPSHISADLRRSHRLKWPIASAWIEAQLSAGRLERVPQDDGPDDA